MPEFESRWPCPVCVGATMEKLLVAERPASLEGREDLGTLTLDLCPRCGGVWFDAGEVARLGHCNRQAFWARVGRPEQIASVPCQDCQAIVSRDQNRCPACGKEQVFACPLCQEPMQKEKYDDLSLDHCRRCQGVWFDHHKLAAIWDREHGRLQSAGSTGKSTILPFRRPQGDPPASAAGGGTLGSVGSGLLEVAAYNPFLALDVAEIAGQGAMAAADTVVSAAPQLLAGAAGLLADMPEVLAGAADSLGDLASAAFEAIVEIINGLFQ